jgi:hypothetical protein
VILYYDIEGVLSRSYYTTYQVYRPLAT